MFAKFLKKIYNIFARESEGINMNLKPISSQISVFLSDGVMNPSRLTDEIQKTFDGVFNKEDYTLNLEEAPNDMPLVRYRSDDGKYVYEFAKKRINFYLNFNENDNMNLFENYKLKVQTVVNEVLLKYSNISRVGLAINYYIDKRDDKYLFWVNKYKFPFFESNSTSEISYTINNNFIYKGLKFNKILILTSGKITNTKNVPIVSIDINNLSTSKISDDTIKYIFEEINFYKKEILEEVLKNGQQ